MIVITEEQLKARLKRNVTALMKSRGVSQRDLAKLTGDSDTQISRVVNGQHVPNCAFLCRIAEALECTLDDLCSKQVKELAAA